MFQWEGGVAEWTLGTAAANNIKEEKNKPKGRKGRLPLIKQVGILSLLVDPSAQSEAHTEVKS